MYSKLTPSSRNSPPPAGRSTADGLSAISSGSSMTWKIRSPDAVARWACPTHMPSDRSGMTSMLR